VDDPNMKERLDAYDVFDVALMAYASIEGPQTDSVVFDTRE
jgi:hypothetical protein